MGEQCSGSKYGSFKPLSVVVSQKGIKMARSFLLVLISKSKNWIAWMLLMLVILWNVACQSIGLLEPTTTIATPELRLIPSQTSAVLPDFLLGIAPAADTKLFFSEFTGGDWYMVPPNSLYDPQKAGGIGLNSMVCVRLTVAPLVQDGDELGTDVIPKRVMFFFDGIEMGSPIAGIFLTVKYVEQTTSLTTWAGPYHDLCWLVPAKIGNHEAIFSFKQTSGDIQEYHWLFEVVAD